jgi:hypothetical protein
MNAFPSPPAVRSAAAGPAAVLACIPAERLGDWWATVLPWLEAVERRSKGKESVAAIRAELEQQHAQLWLWYRGELRALAITEIVQFPGAKVCRVRIVTGRDRHEWAAASLAAIERWAAAIGCSAVEPICRRGWERDLRALGYRCDHLIMQKRVQP